MNDIINYKNNNIVAGCTVAQRERDVAKRQVRAWAAASSSGSGNEIAPKTSLNKN